MTGRPAHTTHGEYGYAHKKRCPCEPCRISVRKYAKRLAYDKARGVARTVDAAPVREHVLWLMELGKVSESQVAAAAGITRGQVRRLVHGNPVKNLMPVEYLLTKTAAALLGVTLEQAMAQPGYTSPVGTERRIQALAARGYSKEDIGRAAGVSGSAVFNWLGRERLKTDTVEKMKRAYDELAMGEGASELMRWRARRLGWLPPLAWDEHTIDDPDAEPDLSMVVCIVDRCTRAVEVGMLCKKHDRAVRRMGGYQSPNKFRDRVLRLGKRETHDPRALREKVAELKEMGVSPHEAARRVGAGVRYVEKIWGQAS